jgi:prepilin-type processing-associated H-X9-DG protein
MARTDTPKRQKSGNSEAQAEARQTKTLQPRDDSKATPGLESLVHVLGPGIICDTDRRGHPTPQGRSPHEIVVDASEGFIPLWESDTILRWRFRERSMDYFEDPAAAKAEIRNLFADALLDWGSAAPVTFTYDEDLWDFEIVMRGADQCNAFGCVLAAAFFPDGGRHELELYPKMFTQVRKEQVDTFTHEIGHVFGLRHFFAQVSEAAWPSEVFGRHEKFSIMNYGELSELTDADREDLSALYRSAWDGELTHINGTPIRLVKAYSSLAPAPDGAFAAGQIPRALRPRALARSLSQAPYPRPRAPQSRSNAAYLDGHC